MCGGQPGKTGEEAETIGAKTHAYARCAQRREHQVGEWMCSHDLVGGPHARTQTSTSANARTLF